jgi:hypothetical protein
MIEVWVVHHASGSESRFVGIGEVVCEIVFCTGNFGRSLKIEGLECQGGSRKA